MAARGRRLGRAVHRFHPGLACRHARRRAGRTHGPGIRQAHGGDRDRGQSRPCLARSRSGAKLWEHLQYPFYDNGPNDKGIGIQLAYSIARVTAGYLLAVAVAIPIGFSSACRR
jgi:hypothetical protein